ncbi:MAG: PAS domain-containing protein [Dehalobacterium sp.]
MSQNFNSIHPKLAQYIPFADALVETFGTSCEIAIHEFSHPESSVVYLAGNVVGRQIGSPITEPLELQLRLYGDNVPNIYNFTRRLKDGRNTKCSNIFIRDDQGKVIGCFCINYDLSLIEAIKMFTDEWIPPKDKTENLLEEKYSDISNVLSQIINDTLSRYSKPVSLMQKEDKLKIVEALDEKGVFLIKGSVENVANAIGVSRYSIYNYLDEIRAARK